MGETAVVIGAGIAGLAAARTLAGRFDRVLLLDRDELPDDPVPRRGVPQGGHGHVLLIAGQRALGELFPGLRDELVEAGGVDLDPGMDLSFYRFGAIWSRIPSSQRLVTFSRPLLELLLRQRVLALPGTGLRTGTAVSALAGAEGRVTGVRLDDGETVEADLVVDCTGRGSRSNQWLTALGFPVPRVTEVGIGLGYATRLYRRSPGDLTDARAIFVLPEPPGETRAGLVLPVEGDRWLVSLGGWHDSFPRDAESFGEHARGLPHPGIAALLDRCEPLADVSVCQFPASRRRHFEELHRIPAGYLALGDAICSFNPVFGQGMTCAALEAVELGGLLDRHSTVTAALCAEHYQNAARIIATPWQFAAGADFAYPQTKGVRPRGIRLVNAYSRRVQLAAMVDPEIRELFSLVQHLVLPPDVLRKPSMVFKVLRKGVRHAGGPAGRAAP
jgi:2-polyprenyl-6-methoxyphenol hydroxylase-like FAD-dependent oxidoreductase